MACQVRIATLSGSGTFHSGSAHAGSEGGLVSILIGREAPQPTSVEGPAVFQALHILSQLIGTTVPRGRDCFGPYF